jgi:hypothetical protein
LPTARNLDLDTPRFIKRDLMRTLLSWGSGAWRALLIILGLGWSVGAGSADPAANSDSIPTHLKISTGTSSGAKFTLELRDGDDLIFRTRPGRGQGTESAIALHPSVEKWRAFRSSLDQLNVWSWKAAYIDSPAPTDGYSWQVELTYRDHKLVSHGYEAAPTHDGSWSPMKGMNSGSDSTYSDFTGAVSALIDEPFN